MSDKTNHETFILRALYCCKRKSATSLFFKLARAGVKIDVHTITNRIQGLRSKGKIIGDFIMIRGEKSAEKYWELVRYDGDGNRIRFKDL